MAIARTGPGPRERDTRTEPGSREQARANGDRVRANGTGSARTGPGPRERDTRTGPGPREQARANGTRANRSARTGPARTGPRERARVRASRSARTAWSGRRYTVRCNVLGYNYLQQHTGVWAAGRHSSPCVLPGTKLDSVRTPCATLPAIS